MRRKYLGIYSLFVMFMLLTFSVGCCAVKVPNLPSSNKIKRVADNSGFEYQSVVFITVQPHSSQLMQDIFGPDWEFIQKSFKHTGSGVVIGTDRMGSDILTAGHVCEQTDEVGEPAPWPLMVSVYDWQGNGYEALVIKYQRDPDMCLLRVPGVKFPQALKFAKEDPEIGSRITNVAYPLGIYVPGAPLLFEGRFSGSEPDGDHFYTIPVAPGSSGSAVLNEDGEIIGIIYAGVQELPMIAIGTPWDEIVEFIYIK